MSWRDHLSQENQITLPWLGGHKLYSTNRTFTIKGYLPRDHGWYKFTVNGGFTARNAMPADPDTDVLRHDVIGYLVGDRIIIDGARCDPNPRTIVKHSEKVHLIEEGLTRFARVRAGRVYAEGPLIYINQEMPLGPETEVYELYQDRQANTTLISGVSPALDAAFQMEVFQRSEVERRRAELEAARVAEELRIAREARRAELVTRLGDGAGRREMALHDFQTAAVAALAVGGAEYLDHKVVRRGEFAVKYRLDGARYECVCDNKLQIIDSGVCLTSHDDGEKGDTYFTLESLPAVIRQAIRERVLVVYRHV